MSRDTLDRYYTPQWAVRQFMEYYLKQDMWAKGSNVFDPCAGDGAILRGALSVLEAEALISCDIDPLVVPKLEDISDCHYAMDCRDLRSHDLDNVDLIITNPPFKCWQSVIEHVFALTENVPTPIIALLRQGAMSSKGRYAWWKEFRPENVYIMPQRPSFTANGRTDGGDYCWVEWSGFVGETSTHLHWLPVVEKK